MPPSAVLADKLLMAEGSAVSASASRCCRVGLHRPLPAALRKGKRTTGTKSPFGMRSFFWPNSTSTKGNGVVGNLFGQRLKRKLGARYPIWRMTSKREKKASFPRLPCCRRFADVIQDAASLHASGPRWKPTTKAGGSASRTRSKRPNADGQPRQLDGRRGAAGHSLEKGRRRGPRETVQPNAAARYTTAHEAQLREVSVPRLRNLRAALRPYKFNKVFAPAATQLEVYNEVVRPIVENVVRGLNCSIIAYGPMGTGKTFTMVGQTNLGADFTWNQDSQAGIFPRAIFHIFERLSGTNIPVDVSMCEVKNQESGDLLQSPVRWCGREDQLLQLKVTTALEAWDIVRTGLSRRRRAQTPINGRSTPSHVVFSMKVEMIREVEMGSGPGRYVVTGTLDLADLASSETLGHYQVADERAEEQSFVALGRVLVALKERRPHVPYRDCELTRFLQMSLTWTKTTLIATVPRFSSDLESGLQGIQETTSDDREGASDDREGASDDCEGASDDREGASDDREGISDDREGASDDREGASDDREGISDDCEGASDDREGASDDREGISDDREGISDDREWASDDREWVSDDCEGISDDCEGASDDREGVSDDREGISDDREGASDDREGASDDREGISDDREGVRIDRSQRPSQRPQGSQETTSPQPRGSQ